MILDLPLTRPDEAERLRTAVYRFSELKRVPPPSVEVSADAGRIAFDCARQAAEFPNYWRPSATSRASGAASWTYEPQAASRAGTAARRSNHDQRRVAAQSMISSRPSGCSTTAVQLSTQSPSLM